jgi:XPG I-region.
MYDLVSVLDEFSIKATGDDYETMKKMIDLNGMRWVECPGEAEYVGVDMVSHGIVDYIMSNDSDCIAC